MKWTMAALTSVITGFLKIVSRYVNVKNKKYNHAFTISWSFDSDLTKEEWESRIDTKEGISEACAHLLKRIQQVIRDRDVDAFDLWDSYEN